MAFEKSDPNPYAAPAITQHPTQALPPKIDDVKNMRIWRDGKILVAANDAEFPDRCIKCNAPTHGFSLRKAIYWHHPALILTILACVLVFIILVVVLRKHAVFNFGLCDRHRQTRRYWSIAGTVLLLTSVVGFFGSLIYFDEVQMNHPDLESFLVVIMIACMFLFLTSLIVFAIGTKIVTAKKIDNEYSYLKGAGEEFLQNFPDVH